MKYFNFGTKKKKKKKKKDVRGKRLKAGQSEPRRRRTMTHRRTRVTARCAAHFDRPRRRETHVSYAKIEFPDGG